MDYIYLVLILIIIAMVVWVWYLLKKKKDSEGEILAVERERDEYVELGKGLSEYNQKLQEKKTKIKNDILDLLETKGKISNRDVATKLGIGRISVIRYLDELEEEGKAEQVGKAGQKVFYIKK